MAKEYKRNPKAQHFKYLEKCLNIGLDAGVSPSETLAFVKSWAKDKK